MTPEQLQAHQNEMAVQRESFQRFWDRIVAPNVTSQSEREQMRLMQDAWNLWREEITTRESDREKAA